MKEEIINIMDKRDIKNRFKNNIVTVIREKDLDFAEVLCKNIISSGIDIVEVTCIVKEAPILIDRLKRKYPNTLIGAGTIVDKIQLKQVLNSGADFIVSPCIVEDVGKYCKSHGIFFSLGVATPTEAFKAYSLGSDIIKVFPGESLGPEFIKALKGPFPYMDLMPTGGVREDNMEKWFEAGAYTLGVDETLVQDITADNLYELRNRCDRLVRALCEFR